MPLELPEEEIRRLRAGEGPAPQIDLINTMTFHAVVAALRLGVFRELSEGPRTAARLARTLEADPGSLESLLELLVTGGYLRRTEPAGGAPPEYAKDAIAAWLGDADEGYGAVLVFWHSLLGELWEGLAESVRTGRPRQDFYAWLEARPRLSERFQNMQEGLASWLGEEVLELGPLPDGATRLLDLGGGHARQSVAYCRRYPGLHATVLDLPVALESGRKTVAAEGLADRITLLPGDLATDAPPGGQDAVLLFNVLHGFDEATAEAIVRRAVAALRPGGRLLLLETDSRPRGGVCDTAFTQGFDLNLRHTQGGRVHPVEQLSAWLTAAGCRTPARHELARSATHVLLVADRV